MDPNNPPPPSTPPWPQTPGPLAGGVQPVQPMMGGPGQPPPPKRSNGAGWLIAGIVGCLAVPLLGTCLLFGFGMFMGFRDVQRSAPDHYTPPPPSDPFAQGNDPYGLGAQGQGGLPPSPGLPAPADPLGANGVAAADARVTVPVTSAQPSRGPADAPVTIVEFADFQCPFCQRATATMHALEQAYPGKIRFVWRNEPLAFHLHAEPAAEAAMEAFAQGGSAKFWQMHDRLYADQQHLEQSDLVHDAAAIGLDMHRFRRALRTQSHAAEIASDRAMATVVGADGTPTFYVNGRKVSGAQPLSVFQGVVDDELARAGAAGAPGAPDPDVAGALHR